MHRSTRRILTTHTGSLPRLPDLVAMLNAKELGEPYDATAFAARVERAISEDSAAVASPKPDSIKPGRV